MILPETVLYSKAARRREKYQKNRLPIQTGVQPFSTVTSRA
jgi:hypothetical protein